MTFWNRSVTVALAAAAFSIVGGLTAGCGGGGGGGGSTPPPTNYTIHGLLQNNAAALAGVVVRYDGNAAYTATTAADGSFSFTVPASAITGADFAAVYFPVGAAPIKKTITEVSGVPQDLGTFDIHVVTVPSYDIHGKIVENGIPVAGLTVKFDNLAAYTVVTDANGNFTLTVPKTAITGADFAAIYITAGGVPAQKTITETAGVPADIGTIDIGLPPPPQV